jgi:glutathione S-transferase
MITVHHLNDSRSERILWLLEELKLDYDIVRYQRDPATRLAPAELKEVHPLGKAPVITDDGRTIAESGAIIDYLVRRYGAGRLQPAADSPAYDQYVEWLHYAEGSAMLPLMLNLYVGRLGDAGAPLQPRIQDEIANHLGYVDAALAGRQWLVEDTFTAADIQMSFVGETAGAFGKLRDHPNLAGWVGRFQARPAYKAAVERGGPYMFAR